MKKIEKLNKEIYFEGENISIREFCEAINKINEIIDILNQSQKQPEGETIRNYNPEKGWDKYKKSKIEVREFDLVPKVELEKQPEEKCIHYFPLSSEGVCQKCGIKFEDIKSEKQEEWRKEWRKLSFEIGSITKQQADEVENFISQLLSEREREVVMEIRGKFWEESEEDFGTYIEEKLSKLLKEGNGRE